MVQIKGFGAKDFVYRKKQQLNTVVRPDVDCWSVILTAINGRNQFMTFCFEERKGSFNYKHNKILFVFIRCDELGA